MKKLILLITVLITASSVVANSENGYHVKCSLADSFDGKILGESIDEKVFFFPSSAVLGGKARYYSYFVTIDFNEDKSVTIDSDLQEDRFAYAELRSRSIISQTKLIHNQKLITQIGKTRIGEVHLVCEIKELNKK